MLNTQTLKEEFIHRYGALDVETYFCPGRVNLIGEHIDYNGGFVLPAAISLGITAIVSKTETNIIRIYSNDFNEEVFFCVSDDFVFHLNEKKHWSDYVKASLQVLRDNGVQLIGANILLASDLPLGAGLSSSAALECLICFIFIFIGAPLGAIVRKGGYGYPLILCIFVFVCYILLNTFCKRLSESLSIDPNIAAWIPCIVMIPPCLMLTWSAQRDRNIFTDVYLLLSKVFQRKK